MFIEIDPSNFFLEPDGSLQLSQIIAVLAPAIAGALQATASTPKTRYWCDLRSDYALFLVGTGDTCRPCDRSGILISYEASMETAEIRSVDGWQEPYGDPVEIDASILIDHPDEFGILPDVVDAIISTCAAAVEYTERAWKEASEFELEDA